MDGKPWRFELLGEIRARYRDGAWMPLPYQKPVALLLYLAASPHRPHPREALVEVLWPEVDPEAGRHSLRAALYSLRRLLESDGASTDGLLLTDRTTLRLNPAAFTSDLWEYLEAVSEAARAQSAVDRCRALGHAAACYQGEFLPGFNEGWAFEERERLLTTQRELLQRLVRVREELEEGEGALEAAREMVRLDPFWEEAHYEVMRLYAALGQPSACLRQYQELERLLREEMGETPSAATRALAEELRASARTVVAAQTSRPLDRPTLRLPTDLPADLTAPPALPDFTSSAEQTFAAVRRVSSLPVQLSRFFGREEEIARVAGSLCLPEVRLVTLTGPGGSGKSRLAIAVAARLMGVDPRACPFGLTAFVPLADLFEASLLYDAIAGALVDAIGRPRSAAREPLEEAVEALRGRPSLLVLDNFEHLVGEGSLQLRRLLECAPSLTCLVTSRQRLGIAGEREFIVLPLPTPRVASRPLHAPGSTLHGKGRGSAPAVKAAARSIVERGAWSVERLLDYPSVQLFVDRAQAVRPEFRLTEGNAASVAELCDRLEGLPLALELAAARAAVLSPAQMVAQMEHRFQLLVTRQRDVPARHRTLRAAVEGSYQGLRPELQQFFRRLSVFRGEWSLEAAAAVCEEPEALDLLTELCECSLVVAEGSSREEGEARFGASGSEGVPTRSVGHRRGSCPEAAGEESGAEELRYRLLETLREYGWEQLGASGGLWEVRNRHQAWYLGLAERAFAASDGPEVAVWLTRLEAELDNLRAALAWCQEEGEARFGASEGCLPRFGRGADSGGVERQRRGPSPGDADPESDAAEAGLRLASALWWFWFRRGSLAEGLQWLEGALARGGHLPASLRAPALLHSAYLVHARGERERAESLLRATRQEYEQALALAHASEDRRAIADATLALTEVTVRTLDVDAARRYAGEARQQMEVLGDRGGLIRTILLMATLALSQGDRQRARPLMEELISLCRELGDSEHLIHALGGMGHLARDEGDYARARAWYEESLALRRKMGNQFALAQSLEDFAVLAGREQQAERAIRLLGADEAFCETLGARLPVTDVQDYERTVAEGRAALGEAAFAAVWAEGRALSLQQAIDYALGET